MSRIRPASRSQAKPLIGLYSESGCGKTYTALVLARGFVGPKGRICMIETESGRGESYANPQEYPEIGGYDVYSLRDDFSPKNYGAAIDEIQKAGYDALIVDSASHEWEGSGGVLDMAAKREESGKKGMLIWQVPKIDHQKHFMLKFMQTSIPMVILNMRAKYPMVDAPNPEKGGKKELHRSNKLDPKQSEDILFEMFVHGWIDKEHNFHPTKITGKGLNSIFEDGKKISVETGQKLAAWASNAPTFGSKDGGPQPLIAEETPEQKIKRMAGAICKAYMGATDTGDIESISHDFKDDIETVKAASQLAYDYIMKTKAEKIATLEAK